MRRRDLLSGLLLATATRNAAHAQPSGKVYRIAIVRPSGRVAEDSEVGDHPYFPAFFKELRRLGYVEGQNLVVERFSGEGQTERGAELARTVVASKPDVIIAISPRSLLHLKEATTTIPITAITSDPVSLGLVTNLARPGGNFTGVSVDAGIALLGKRLEILKEAAPTISRVGFPVLRPAWEGTVIPRFANEVRQAAAQLGITLLGAVLDSPVHEAEYRRAFAAMAQERVDALLVSEAPENFTHRRLIIELAEKARLPTMSSYRDYVALGGLMAYGIDLVDVFLRIAGQVDKILKGANSGDIPFQQPTKFELIINAKTARALGLEMPPSLLARATEVIE
jgi:putative ABC transport system substrate-binding protein